MIPIALFSFSVMYPSRCNRNDIIKNSAIVTLHEAKLMAVSFVLISTAPAKEHEVYNELLKVKEIVELHPLFGEYDLIAKIEAEDFNLLGQVVVDKVRAVPGVIDTKTLTGIKF